MLFRGGRIGHQELHHLLKPFAMDAGLDQVVIPKYNLDGEEISDGRENSDEEPDEDLDIEDNGQQVLDAEEDTESDEKTDEEELSSNEEHVSTIQHQLACDATICIFAGVMLLWTACRHDGCQVFSFRHHLHLDSELCCFA